MLKLWPSRCEQYDCGNVSHVIDVAEYVSEVCELGMPQQRGAKQNVQHFIVSCAKSMLKFNSLNISMRFMLHYKCLSTL